jgi:hypothetical protein
MRADPQFYARVKKAKTAGKLRLVKRVRNAKPWQAAAWILERTHGKEFGRKDVREVRQKRTVKHEHHVTIDYDQLARDLERFAGGRVSPDRNGEPVHSGDADTPATPLLSVARS